MIIRLTSIVFIAAALISCTPEETPAQLCNQTVKDYATYRDNPEMAKAYADLFSLDGTFTLGPNTTEGRDTLIARHIASHENATWQHNMNEISIRDKDAVVTGTSRVTVKTSSKDDPNTTRKIVADYEDNFELIGDKCLIKSRIVKILTDDISSSD